MIVLRPVMLNERVCAWINYDDFVYDILDFLFSVL